MTEYIDKFTNACITGDLKKAKFYYELCYEDIDSNIFVQIYYSIADSNIIFYDVLNWLINTPEIIIEFEFFDKYDFLNDNIILNINFELFKWIYYKLMKFVNVDKECIERMLYISACSVGNIELVSWFISNNDDLKYEIEGFKLAAFGYEYDYSFTICMKTGTYTFPKPKPSKIITLLMSLSPFQYLMNDNNCTILTKEVAVYREKRYCDKLLLASCLQEVNNNFINKPLYYVLGNEDLLRNVSQYL